MIASTLAAVGMFAISLIPAHALTLGADDLAQLNAREVVITVSPDDRGADGVVEAAIDVAAPRTKVWPVLLDCARAPSFMPALKSCSVLEIGPGDTWDVREHRVSWTDLLPDSRSVFRSDYVKETSIRFSRVEGDLKHLEGEWKLEPLGGGETTRLRYRARIGLSLPIPAFLVRSALKRDVPAFLKALRDQIERPAD